MNNSKTTPLSLQVYKTHAEFKAFRLNRTEQCRLESTHVYLSREERNFHKDLRTSRVKMETDLMRRRLSAAESVGKAGPTAISASPWSGSSTATTPRAVSAVSQRRSSELPSSSYSSRRGSLWSWPDAMSSRGKALHRRRQTYGGHSAGLPSSRPVSLASVDTASVVKVPSDCDFCGKVSEFRTSGECAEETNEKSLTNAGESCPHGANTAVINKGEESSDNNRPAGSENSEREVLSQVPVDAQAPTDNGKAREEKQSEKPTPGARHSSRRYSKSAFSGRGGTTRGFQATEAASLEDTLVQEENQNGADPSLSQAEPPGVSESGGKSDRKVSIVEPPSKAAHTFPKPSVSQSSLSRTRFSDDNVNEYANVILEHTEQCTMGGEELPARTSSALGPYRQQSASIVDLRRRSGPLCSSDLVRRMSHFLDQQADFNKLFPLKNHDIKFYKNPRPDLLKASRAKEKQVSKQKAMMISEVMEKLGLTDNGMSTDSKTAFPKL